MFYRLFTVLIIVFWMTMTALLVRKELGPGDLALREVPLTHVAKTMFTHEQPSELQVYNEKLAVGHMRVHPRVRKQDGQRKVEFTGTLQVEFPGLARQRVSWNGELLLDEQLQAQKIKMGLTFRDPAAYTVDLDIDPEQHLIAYESKSGGVTMKRSQISLTEKGITDWLRDQGIDPGPIISLGTARSTPPVVRAQQSTLSVHGEKIETWLVSLEQGGQTMLEAHVSQLGQILRIRTFAGYSAAPEDLSP